ncbi:MAG: NADH-quinone oxidoreductase subunit B family protein [Candidatus Methylacidiphilaceae bacterium]
MTSDPLRPSLFGLVRSGLPEPAPPVDETAVQQLSRRLDETARRRLGRSLGLRLVDAGSCNGCELELHALQNPFYDLERFGLRFVASPRHADVLLVTGPTTRNMREALERTYHAIPEPKWVVAVGDCAATGGLFSDVYACVGAAERVIPVDLTIPGCPPRPRDLLAGLLALFESTGKTGRP